MITKPEDAMPRELWDYENKFGDEANSETMRSVKGFTAAECAEIARAYATAFYKENRYMETIEMKHKTAEEWRAKFAEWEGK